MLQVLVDGRVEVLGVALVDAVDLPLRLDLHVLLGQDELADGLKVGNVYRDLKQNKTTQTLPLKSFHGYRINKNEFHFEP